MVLNQFVIKEYAALILASFMSVILFVVGNIYYGLLGGIGFMFAGMLLGVLIGVKLLTNPFSKMLKGKGLLVLNLDSTGVLRPFIVGLSSPYIKGVLNGEVIEDVFDRDAVFNLATPVDNSSTAFANERGGLTIDIDEQEYNQGRFALFHFPVLFWNDQIKSIITKDFLANEEKNAFANHSVLYMNRKMQELTSDIKNFARHIVDSLKPKTNIFQAKWVMYVIIGVIVLLIILFFPTIMNLFGGATSAVSGATSSGASALGGAPVTPI